MRQVKMVLLVFLIFLASITAAETQILKPTAFTDSEGQTSSPSNAFDMASYDESTAAVTSEPRADPSITYENWETTGKQDYLELNISVTVSSSGYTDDTWAIYFDDAAENTCDSTDNALKPSGSQNVGLRNYTASLPPTQNLGNLEVCVTGAKSGSPDKGRSVSFYDIRTEGVYDQTPPEWRNQSQNNSVIRPDQTNGLRSQAKDNFNLSYGTLATNETGTWENKSSYGSPDTIFVEDRWTWSNFTWKNDSIQESEVSWKVWYNDTSGNYNSTETRTFSVDGIKPDINLFSPLNRTLDQDTVDLQVNANEDVSSWLYNLDSTGNQSFTPNTTIKDLSDGKHSLTVWASDRAGNWNRTEVFFTVDTTPPTFSNLETVPESPAPFGKKEYIFNVTVEDQNTASVSFEFSGKNYSVGRSGNEFSSSLSNLSAGSYSYRWYANDTAGNENSIEVTNYEISKAYVNTTLFLNGTYGPRKYGLNETANLSVGLNESKEVEIWTNFTGVLERKASGQPLLEYFADTDYGIGTFLVKGVFPGSENYSAANQSFRLEAVDRSPPEFLDFSDSEGERVFKGEEISLSVLWEDNVELSDAVLSTNITGDFQNISSKPIENGYGNFTYTYPLDRKPGTLGWQQYANDTSGNYRLSIKNVGIAATSNPSVSRRDSSEWFSLSEQPAAPVNSVYTGVSTDERYYLGGGSGEFLSWKGGFDQIETPFSNGINALSKNKTHIYLGEGSPGSHLYSRETGEFTDLGTPVGIPQTASSSYGENVNGEYFLVGTDNPAVIRVKNSTQTDITPGYIGDTVRATAQNGTHFFVGDVSGNTGLYNGSSFTENSDKLGFKGSFSLYSAEWGEISGESFWLVGGGSSHLEKLYRNGTVFDVSDRISGSWAIRTISYNERQEAFYFGGASGYIYKHNGSGFFDVSPEEFRSSAGTVRTIQFDRVRNASFNSFRQDFWGYSESNLTLSKNSVQLSEDTEARCRVIDSNSTSPIGDQFVEIYNGGKFVDEGYTGSNGWFNTTFSEDSTQDQEPVTCNIFRNSSASYQPVNNGTASLTVNSGQPPELSDGVYGRNSSRILVGESLRAFAQWNSSLDYGYIEYDTEDKDAYIREYSQSPFQNNYTNFTLNSTVNWFKGSHSFKIYANDTEGNLNNTLSRKQFEVVGFSNVSYRSPEIEADRGIVELRADVLDANTSEKIPGYNVSFHYSGSTIGVNSTNTTGTAVYNWNTSELETGGKNVSVSINDSKYYNAAKNRSEGNFTVLGSLKPVILEPDGILNRGINYTLSADVENDQGETVSPQAVWSNSSGSIIADSVQGYWEIPKSYDLGKETLELNVSKNNYRNNSTETRVRIYGRSRISDAALEKPKIDEGEQNTFRCRIETVESTEFIGNYPVEFENGTETLGTNLTNSTGWAEYRFTDTSPGNESYYCEISDNSTLKYNKSEPFRRSERLETVDTTDPEYTVENPSQGEEIQKQDTIWFNSTWADNFELSSAIFSFNDTGSFVNQTVDLEGSIDQANYPFQNTSFEGILGYSIYGNDTYGNYNSTERRTATIYGGADLEEIELSSETVSPGSSVDVTCRVTDNQTGSPVSGYPVSFLNGTDQISSGTTGQQGESVFSYSQGFEGDADLGCRIEDQPEGYYRADNAEVSGTVSFEFGTSTEKSESLSVNGGELEGSRTELEELDSNYLNWQKIRNSSVPGEKALLINSTTEIPPSTVRSVDFRYNVLRNVNNFGKSVNDPGGDGSLTFSNGDINSTWSYDGEYMELSEAQSGNAQNLARKGLYFHTPETVSETTFNRLEVEAEIKSFNNNGESLDADIYNPATGSYIDCVEYGGDTYQNTSCQFTDNATISEIINGDRISLEFQDGFSTSGESQSSWRVDRVNIRAFYENPGTGNSFEYSVGFRNRSSGSLVKSSSIDINGTRGSVSVRESRTGGIVSKDGRIQSYLTTFVNNTPGTESYRNQQISLDRYETLVNYEVSKSKDIGFNLSTGNEKAVSGVNYTVFQDGDKIDSFSSDGAAFEDKLADNRTYRLEKSIPDEGSRYNVTFWNFTVDRSTNISTRFLNRSQVSSPKNVENISSFYALDQNDDFRFDRATLKIPKKGTEPDVILHCTEFNFSIDSCESFEIDPLSSYNLTETQDYIELNVTEFSAFGTGNGEPLPNITDIRIYNLSEQEDIRTGGNLLESGINETFRINQSRSETNYRFEFDIVNEGSQDWNIATDDSLRHSGLNTTWRKEEAFYNISGTVYTGGTKDGDVLNWETASGGTLQQGEEMTAAYTVNTSTVSSNFYDMSFLVNDTDENAGSQDFHELNKTKFGFLNVTLLEPPLSFSAQQDSTFTVNSTVRCEEGRCGQVSVSTRYNESSAEPRTLVPSTESQPFYLNSSNNIRSCGKLQNGELCTESWTVNATGQKGSKHLIDVNSSSSYSRVSGNDTRNSEITIVESLILEIDWNKADFGAIKPGEQDHPALGNFDLKYNVTVPENSKSASQINISGQNLNNSKADGYGINITNIGFNLANESSSQTQLSNSEKVLSEDVQSGTDLNTFYWIDVPEGLKSDTYSGVIRFEAYE